MTYHNLQLLAQELKKLDKKLSMDFTLNGTHLHLESTRLTSSEHSFITVSASVPRPLCCGLPLMILRIFCRVIATPGVLLPTTCMNDVVTRNQNKLKDPITTVPKRDVFIVLPYLGLQSKFITKQLKSCICKFYGCIHLNSILALEINFSYNDEIV